MQICSYYMNIYTHKRGSMYVYKERAPFDTFNFFFLDFTMILKFKPFSRHPLASAWPKNMYFKIDAYINNLLIGLKG
jgi:hypothetical protein